MKNLELSRIFDQIAKNFILSSGCDIPMNTPLENIEAFMKAARE